MPNELKMCSVFSTPNLFYPADHHAPLRTDSIPVNLGGNGRIASSHVCQPSPLNRNHSILGGAEKTAG
jgi:hypothetical protein